MSESSKPSILFVSHKFPPATGGMERQSFELITGLGMKAAVHKIVFDGGEPILRFFQKLNGRILEMLEKHPDISIIHFNDGLIASLALFHKGYTQLKRVVTVHGLDVVFPLRYFQQKILPKFNRYDAIIAVSQATANALAMRGVHPDIIHVINNGVDHQSKRAESNINDLKEKHSIPKDKKLLLMLGRPVKRKGFSWFVRNVLPTLDDQYYLVLIGPFDRKRTSKEAWLNRLPKRLSHLLMLFLGFASDQHDIRELLQNKTYNKRFGHVGKLPLDELQPLLASATAFLMPNIHIDGDMEGFGLVCLEASIAGTLVVAADLEGIQDAITHQKNGLLLPSASANAWTKKLNHIITEETTYHALAKRFAAYSKQHYSWSKMCQEYETCFAKLIDT